MPQATGAVLLVVLLGLAGPLPAGLAADSVGGTEARLPDYSASRYLRTVRALTTSPEAVRGEFAALALAELAEVLLAEADLARSEARQQDVADKLLGWSAAVEGYAGELLSMLQQVELGAAVDLRLQDGGAVALAVAERTVLLVHPRSDQQLAFEQRLLQAFCDRQRCRDLTLESGAPEPIPVTAAAVRPAWSFTQDGPRCSYLGLQLQFAVDYDLQRARFICEQLAAELARLVRAVDQQQRHGVRVEWAALAIRPLQGDTRHLLTLSTVGDAAVVELPLLHATPGLLPRVLPWARARLAAQGDAALVLQAGEFGW